MLLKVAVIALKFLTSKTLFFGNYDAFIFQVLKNTCTILLDRRKLLLNNCRLIFLQSISKVAKVVTNKLSIP